MSPTSRSAVVGALLALLVISAVIALFATGVVPLPSLEKATPERVLVILIAPDEDAQGAPFAFVLSRGQTAAELLDTTEPVVVSGTSATTAREAYPFVGGAGVARALAEQTGGQPLEWIALPPEEWAAVVDAAGGLQVSLPLDVSVYRDGRLTVLEEGTRRLSGEDAVALASALTFIEPEQAREQVTSQLAAGVSAMVAAQPGTLADSVVDGRAESSLEPAEVRSFTTE